MDSLQRLQSRIKESQFDGMMITDPANRRYVSGFTGSAGTLLVTARAARLITDFRYVEQAEREAAGFEIVKQEKYMKTVAQSVSELGISRLGFESEHITYKLYQEFADELSDIELVPTEKFVRKLRERKAEGEIAYIKKAVEITDRAFAELLPLLRIGQTELEIALKLEFLLKELGSEGLAFDIIAASGPNSALPHARPSERAVQPGDFLVLDFGARYNGYCADMTRTVVFGQPDSKQREVYETVLRAQRAGVAEVAAGKTGAQVDKASREIIEEAGYGDRFGHAVGHGVGLEVHEGPAVAHTGKDPLEDGMVVTVEPGIYLPGWGGVRIEDLVVVREGGCDILTQSQKEMIILEN